MRENKYRYLVLRLTREFSSLEAVEEHIRKCILLLFGVYGLSCTLPRVIYKSKEGMVVVRVKREGVKILRASLLLDTTNSIIVVKTTGTTRKAKRIADSIQQKQ
ncbi:Rpp14/Pop5 family protein [Infirmifilum lucidum]|uniref:Rpp14/Pop5 family protein n=1 Tax=Infirmifilum lucidum TaxID=2776706 RepID=A0A7L9FEL8_9CREN|nr:Rpp14/Pop5 family protein [Infirmifilum lucidum]QOJ78248.1 Rpp14/Pop5 family protein [Infirmifilum lucidum]